jgi:hypothetical protein
MIIKSPLRSGLFIFGFSHPAGVSIGETGGMGV